MKHSHLAAALQEDEGVEGLEDVDGGLMDRHHDCAPVPGHILDALHHDGCRTRVQPCMEPTCPGQPSCPVK